MSSVEHQCTDPSDIHLSLLEDKAFDAHLAQVQQDRDNKEAPAPRGKGVKCKNTASKEALLPRPRSLGGSRIMGTHWRPVGYPTPIQCEGGCGCTTREHPLLSTPSTI